MFDLCRVREAPAEWLVDVNRRPTFMFIAVVTMLSLVVSVGSGMAAAAGYGVGINPLYMGFAMSTASVGASFLFTFQKFALPPRTLEVATLVILCSFSSMGSYLTILIPDPAARNRVLALMAVAWQPLPALLGLRVLHCTIFFVWSTVGDCASWLVIAAYYECIPVRAYGALLIYHLGFLGAAVWQQERLRSFYDVQQQLMAEKESFEKLLAMVCDATLWLATDGDTVLRSDQRFDAIVGQ